MKRTLAVTTALAAALALAACQDQKGEDAGAVENASAESGVGSNPASNAVQDAAGAAVGAAGAAVAGRTTEGFVTNAAIADMYEIEAGRIASEKAKSADLKAMGKMLVTDHTKMSADMKAALGSAGANVTLPTQMDERRQGMIDNLKQAPADGFDQVFIGQQVAAHEESLTLHQTYAENGDNAALKALAAKHRPMIEQHLNKVRAMEGKGGGQGGQAPAKSGGTGH
jgi:putative membrane protein